MTKFDHNQVCTPNKVIEVGERYQYKEEGEIADVTILADNSNEKQIVFKLRIDRIVHGDFFKVGHEFDVSASRGLYAYNGMWRLYPLGEYINSDDLRVARRAK